MRNLPFVKKQSAFPSDLDFGRIIDGFLSRPFLAGFYGAVTDPAIDVYQKDDKIVVKAEMPGVDQGDINISVDGDILTITGEKKEETETKKENYFRLETSCGKFRKEVLLPSEVKAEDAKAGYEKGVLKVELPKAEAGKKKEIKIDVK